MPSNPLIPALQQERDNRFATSGVIRELLLVVPVLSQRPNRHLRETRSREHTGRQALGHHREGRPRVPLVRIVRTRHVPEQKRKGVAGGHRYLPLGATLWPEIPERQMDGQVAGFEEQERYQR